MSYPKPKYFFLETSFRALIGLLLRRSVHLICYYLTYSYFTTNQ